MTPLVKAGVAGGVLTTIGGTAYAGTTYFKSPTEEISKLIDKEYTHILLKTGATEDTEYWTKNWQSYVDNNKGKDSDVFQLTGWQKDGKKDVKEELKKKCTSLKTEKVYSKDDELYKNVTKYCGRWVTVKDEAEKKGFTILDITKPIPSETNVWEPKTKIAKADLEKLDIKEPTPNAENVRVGCEKAKDKNKQEKKYQEIYDAYVKTCANPKPST